MLQQQQADLTKFCKNKSSLKKSKKKFELKLIAVEDHINDQITQTSSSGDSFDGRELYIVLFLLVGKKNQLVILH